MTETLGNPTRKPKRSPRTTCSNSRPSPASRRAFSHWSALYGVTGLSRLRSRTDLGAVGGGETSRANVSFVVTFGAARRLLPVGTQRLVPVDEGEHSRMALGNRVVFGVPRFGRSALSNVVFVTSQANGAGRKGRACAIPKTLHLSDVRRLKPPRDWRTRTAASASTPGRWRARAARSPLPARARRPLAGRAVVTARGKDVLSPEL